MGDTERRRRRLRTPSAAKATTDDAPTDAPTAATPVTDGVSTPPIADPEPAAAGAPAAPAPAPAPARTPRGRAAEEHAERGLRGLVGSGSSQVSVSAALRARDAARPTPEHLADAEENLPIVRRNWVPRESLPRGR
ncbi:hypothetical protein [Mangrovihabitans endophyticus]|uniref:Uncharacterized protein n=1 Tax=Mangrovihabitans endophyticus TaxID=1751298 RepID=A0A8J3C526_9ACTN|nr:hypothetical protein [Mangrovihabitans endophyticus]GGL20145.1 hypothetical protein GCM10012284_63470 [Mangrovihabitans endophyticus]